jgi:hypothetical protein
MPGVGLQQSCKDAHSGGLAGTIGPEKCHDSSTLDVEVNSVERTGGPESLNQPFGVDRAV